MNEHSPQELSFFVYEFLIFQYKVYGKVMPVQVFPDIFSVEMFTLYMYDLIGQTHGRSVDLLPYFPVLYTLQMVAAIYS